MKPIDIQDEINKRLIEIESNQEFIKITNHDYKIRRRKRTINRLLAEIEELKRRLVLSH